jgi:ATP-dependent Clp protease ATP-binding subunit ClpC
MINVGQKVLSWDRLGIDVTIKEFTPDECKDIIIRTYPNAKDYKLYVMSRCVYSFIKILKHIRLYSSHYGVEESVLHDELFKLVCAVNPDVSDKFKLAGHATCAPCGTPSEEPQTKKFTDITKEEILSLGGRVKDKVLGQEKAIDKIILAIQIASAGLRDPEQPIGSFLLTGPTGVGKTLLAKVLTDELIGDKECLVRIDCSEYQQRHEVSKLTGAPHGYIGYEQGGILTNTMKKFPFSIVLFDEIEKAHEKVYNVLLQIMDEGILTSNTGETVSFKDSVILLTSNLGVAEAKKAKKEVGFEKARTLSDTDRMEAMERALSKKFRPEFLNRLDAVSHFMPLDDEGVCKEIVVLELEMLLSYLYTNKKMRVRYSPEVVDFIYKKGFDSNFGARPLKRAIRKYFANSLSHMILTKEPEEGAVIIATLGDKEIVFSKE